MKFKLGNFCIFGFVRKLEFLEEFRTSHSTCLVYLYEIHEEIDLGFTGLWFFFDFGGCFRVLGAIFGFGAVFYFGDCFGSLWGVLG